MLRIWHGGEWLKRDLSHPFYGWVEHGSPISSWFIDVYVDFMADMLMIFLSLLCWLYA